MATATDTQLVTATAKYVRTSASKVRAVLDLIRGLDVKSADGANVKMDVTVKYRIKQGECYKVLAGFGRGARQGRRIRQRQVQCNGRALSGAAFDADLPAMGFDNLARCRQTQSRAARLGREKRIEDSKRTMKSKIN